MPWETLVNNALNLAAFELEYYWRPGSFNWACSVFFINRYVALVGHLPVVYQCFVPPSTIVHHKLLFANLTLYHSILVMVLQVLTAVLMIMRMYALYNRNRYILATMLVVIAAGIAWIITVEVKSAALGLITDSEGEHIAAAWTALLLFDTTVFVLTMYKVRQVGRIRRQPLLRTLFRDGVVYYVIILIINVINIFVWARAPGVYKGITSTPTNVISVTMMSRLMLNLRAPQLTHLGELPTTCWDDRPVNSRPWISSVIELNPNASPHMSFQAPETEWHALSERGNAVRTGTRCLSTRDNFPIIGCASKLLMAIGDRYDIVSSERHQGGNTEAEPVKFIQVLRNIARCALPYADMASYTRKTLIRADFTFYGEEAVCDNAADPGGKIAAGKSACTELARTSRSLALGNDIFVNTSTSAAAFVILYYDYLLTLSMEQERYWTKRSLNWPGCLFFANRYIAVVGHLPVMYQTFGEFLDLPIILKNPWVIAMAQVRGFAEGPLDVRQGRQIAVAWSAFLAFDTIIFVLTMWRVLTIGLARRQPLLQALLRDGILYYIVLLGANLLNIILLLRETPVLRGMMATASNVLSVTIISRLMLNIRDPRLNRRVNNLPTNTVAPVSDPSRNIGDAPIVHCHRARTACASAYCYSEHSIRQFSCVTSSRCVN
ncbi:hypothetical protein EVG20_g4394 [Dentipellis fragilis]|uniref:DUF6533 domain-containing protein n=1 Tax=Dentipellis fragilis TaxID=205917 RepID=A0A4Y9YVT2_9AGAM|nr:hypothetical protein EVG20_g4394 [Dentipellis fragilis]